LAAWSAATIGGLEHGLAQGIDRHGELRLDARPLGHPLDELGSRTLDLGLLDHPVAVGVESGDERVELPCPIFGRPREAAALPTVAAVGAIALVPGIPGAAPVWLIASVTGASGAAAESAIRAILAISAVWSVRAVSRPATIRAIEAFLAITTIWAGVLRHAWRMPEQSHCRHRDEDAESQVFDLSHNPPRASNGRLEPREPIRRP
jgi:hypothetical protein